MMMKKVRRTRLETARAGARRAALAALLLTVAAAAGGAVAGRARAGQLVVRVTDSGFSPASATAEPGLVHLSLVNGGGSERVRIRIGREGGGLIREVEVHGEGEALSTELEAAAGVYTLTEAERGWVFRLTVSAPAPTPTPAEPPGGE